MATPLRIDEGVVFRAADGRDYMPYDVFHRVSAERNLLRDALDALGNGDERYFALALRLLTKRGKS